jgi:hypothetical protein
VLARIFLGSMRALFSIASMIALAGCDPHPGEGDLEAAREVVYSHAGSPAYAGQALVIQSCGAGLYCHTNGIADAVDHFGAPEGLGFDLRVASSSSELDDEATQRLVADQQRITSEARLVWGAVSSGRMPPGGAAWDEYRDGIGRVDGAAWDRFEDDGVTFEPLPGIDTPEGLEVFRNWLAAGAPFVERTQPSSPTTDPQGDIVPLCERTCVRPTWPAIYAEIVVPSCALSRCHDASDSGGDLDLVTGGEAGAHARMLDQFAEGSRCRLDLEQRLVAGEPESSLFYTKVAAATSDDVCGARMPLVGNRLTEQRLCAIREWILCGACVSESDEACSTCMDAAYATCGVTEAGECVQQVSCSNRPPG